VFLGVGRTKRAVRNRCWVCLIVFLNPIVWGNVGPGNGDGSLFRYGPLMRIEKTHRRPDWRERVTSMKYRPLLGLCVLCFACQATVAAERPNVIVFISDDVSWNDYGCYGNRSARTPVIDQLASAGLRFDKEFVTGRYSHNNGKAVELHQPISANLAWFPAMLKQAGYHTVLSGKNHMGKTKGGGNRYYELGSFVGATLYFPGPVVCSFCTPGFHLRMDSPAEDCVGAI
jgi:hypothetical protein